MSCPCARTRILRLGVGTAHSVVVDIVPVFKNILFSCLYSSPLPAPRHGVSTVTLRILDGRTTQGTGLQACWAH